MTFISKALVLALLLSGAATVTSAQEATNPAVIARHDLMKTQAKAAKVLGDMAKGTTAFDAAAAEAAKAELVGTATDIPAKFEANEEDPASEAKPEVWSNWDDFVAKGEALLAAAKALDTSSLESVQAGMGGVGGACGACHKIYRE